MFEKHYSKDVKRFSLMKNLQIQQTPKPSAQEPDEVPPLFEHSSLQIKCFCQNA
jgi:hypothetical protein